MTRDPYASNLEPPAFSEQGIDPARPGPEDVEIMGERILALLIDLVVANVAAFITGLVVAVIYPSLPLLYAVGTVTVLGYFVVLEATQGQTLGKALLGLRVVHDDGSPIGWGAALVRNLLRLVDGLFFFLVGFLVAMMNPLRQRIGDAAAGTLVIED